MKYISIQSFLMSVSLVALGGCTLAPKYERPVVDVPSQLQPGQDSGTDSAMELDRWWEQFEDENLNALIAQGLERNSDLAIAASRIMEARAVMGQATADLFPSLSGQAAASRRNAPDAEVQPGMSDPANSFSVNGLLSYELDLLGKIRNSRAAAKESLLSTTYAYYSIRNSMISDIASLYYQGVGVVEQIDLAEQTILTRQEALSVQQKRYDSGFITQLQLQQTKAELADARVNLPILKELLHSIKIALHLIVGTDPARYWTDDPLMLSGSRIPDTPDIQPSILPASLLERRPDVLAAEADLRAAYHNIGIARAQRWPSLSISGLIGTSGEEIDELFTDPTGTWSIGGTLAGPVYDFGKSRNRIRVSEQRKSQAGWNYRQVVLRAMSEVNLSLASIQYSGELVMSRQVQCDAFGKTLELARLQYQQGYSDYLELLDAERRLFSAKLALVEARYSSILAYIQLCRALGGGWDQTINGTEIEDQSVAPAAQRLVH